MKRLNSLFTLLTLRFSWWRRGRGGGCRRWWWWRWWRGWSGRGRRGKWQTVQPEAAKDSAEIRSATYWYHFFVNETSYSCVWDVRWVMSYFFVFPLSEPVNRKQSNPSLFDTHRSPARRSHIRLVEMCGKLVKSDAKHVWMCDSAFSSLFMSKTAPWLLKVCFCSFILFTHFWWGNVTE